MTNNVSQPTHKNSNLKEIEDKSLTELAVLYNQLVLPEQHIKRFSDRPTALKRITALFMTESGLPKAVKLPTESQRATLLEKIEQQKPSPTRVKGSGKVTLDLSVTTKTGIKEQVLTKKEAKATPATVVQNKIGKRISYFGTKIYILAKGNPRMVGSAGWRSFNLYKDGMPYEDYLKKGGENKHFFWDLKNNFIKVV